jgi:cytochrome c553
MLMRAMTTTKWAAAGWIAALGLGVSATAVAEAERAEQLTRIALELDANAERGAELYRAQCADCHGAAAEGKVRQMIPVLAGQRRAYIVKQLADFVEGDRIATQMHRVVSRQAVREPQAWADLALYLNNLPPPQRTQIGNGRFLQLGEASYEQWCSSCHDEDGRGDDDGFVPSVRNQHYSYLLKETRNLAAGHRFNVDEDLRRFLNSLKSDEQQGIADYMSRMQGPLKDRARMNPDGTVSD